MSEGEDGNVSLSQDVEQVMLLFGFVPSGREPVKTRRSQAPKTWRSSSFGQRWSEHLEVQLAALHGVRRRVAQQWS